MSGGKRKGAVAIALLLGGLIACGEQPSSGDAAPSPASDREAAAAIEAARGGRREPLADEERLRAGFLVVDGVYNTELMAPYDVFEHTRAYTAPGLGIEVFTVSPDGATVTTAEGLRVLPDHGFADAPPIDILVVPSAVGSRDRDLEDERLIGWVRDTGARARYVVSLCWGAFVLAEAGLLEGRAVTTFPGDYDTFSRRFPQLDLRLNLTFVHDGPVLTSQGGVRSYDVAMYLVDLLYGEEVARGVGRGLLIPWPPGPQPTIPYLVQNAGAAANRSPHP